MTLRLKILLCSVKSSLCHTFTEFNGLEDVNQNILDSISFVTS